MVLADHVEAAVAARPSVQRHEVIHSVSWGRQPHTAAMCNVSWRDTGLGQPTFNKSALKRRIPSNLSAEPTSFGGRPIANAVMTNLGLMDA